MFKKSGTLIENTKSAHISAEFGTKSNFDAIKTKDNSKSNNNVTASKESKESKETGDRLSNFIADNNNKESSDFGSGGLSVEYPEIADNTKEQV